MICNGTNPLRPFQCCSARVSGATAVDVLTSERHAAVVQNAALRREGLIALRYRFHELFVNGESFGIYAFEEHFGKRLIENNGRREGPTES